MSVSYMNLPQLIPILSAWCNEQKVIFLRIAEIAPFLPQIEEVHQEAVSSAAAAQAQATVASLTEEIGETDVSHDLVLRALWYVANGAAMWLRVMEPSREGEAARIEKALRRILPEGLSHVKHAYAQEAGYGEQVSSSMDEELEATLKIIPFPYGTGLDVSNRWFELAEKLGDLDRQRAVVETGASSTEPPVQVRTRAIKLIGLVMEILDSSWAPAEDIEQIRGPVLKAIEAAKRRYAARHRDDETEDTETQDLALESTPDEEKPREGGPTDRE